MNGPWPPHDPRPLPGPPRGGKVEFVLLACSLSLPSCSPAINAEPPTTVPTLVLPADAPLADSRELVRTYTSKRLELALALPDGRAWRIDDHSSPQLIATHPATRSKLTLELFATPNLVSRHTCQALVAERGDSDVARLSKGSPAPIVLEDESRTGPAEFDTRVVLTLEPEGKGAPIRGHLFAFGGRLKKCFFFHFDTRASSERLLGARLGAMRAIAFEGLRFKDFDEVKRLHGP